MSGTQFGEAVCPPPTRCRAESGTQWGQAAAEREWGHSRSAISTKENGTFRGVGVLFEVSQGERGWGGGGGTGTSPGNTESKGRWQGVGESRCPSTRCIISRAGIDLFAFCNHTHTLGLVCERQGMNRMWDYTKGLKRLLIRRQQCRSYLSWVHLFPSSCTLVIWSTPSKNLLWRASSCHCCLLPCDVFGIRFKNRPKSCRGK